MAKKDPKHKKAKNPLKKFAKVKLPDPNAVRKRINEVGSNAADRSDTNRVYRQPDS